MSAVRFISFSEKKMKNKKIKLLIERWGMRSIHSEITVVENTLDENYKLIKSERVETIHTIHFNYEWINRERDQLFSEVAQWEHLFRSLCDQLWWKTIRGNIFGCVVANTTENKNAVKTACLELQKKLNILAEN